MGSSCKDQNQSADHLSLLSLAPEAADHFKLPAVDAPVSSLCSNSVFPAAGWFPWGSM